MIQVISKFLILILTLTTFGVNPTVAEDTKDIKIFMHKKNDRIEIKSK